MNRRRVLFVSGVTLSPILAGCTSSDDAEERNDDRVSDEDESEPENETITDNDADDVADPDEIDPQTFADSDDLVSDEIEIDGGLTVIEATHDGDSAFTVSFHRGMNDAGVSFVDTNGAYDGETAAILQGGWMSVRADSDWSVEIRQPRAASGDSLPQSFAGDQNRVFGPIEFNGTHTVSGRYYDEYPGKSKFQVHVYSMDTLISDVFDETGRFDGETTFSYDGIGWVAVESGGVEWSLEIE